MGTIEQTVHQFLDEMHRVGYGTDRLKTAASTLEGLCAYHTTANFHYLDKQLTERYIDSLREMLDYNPTGQRYAQEQIVIIKIFLDFVDSGKITEIRYTLPLISQWLGHSRLETTLIYAYADTEQKRKAIEKAIPEDSTLKTFLNSERYRLDDDDLIKRLYGLK